MLNDKINLGFSDWKESVSDTFTNEPLTPIEAARIGFEAGIRHSEQNLLAWAKECYERAVQNRPDKNIHKQMLHTTWTQVINKLK